MPVISSQTIKLGTLAPDFHLLDTISGQYLNLNQLKSEVATVIVFMCNHCPYVKHILPKLIELSNLYLLKKINFIAISSNDASNYPEDAPDKMQQLARQLQFPFAYLYDESQQIAQAYDAVCTPDIYVLDKTLRNVYHGRFDASSPKNDIPVTGQDLHNALDCILNNQPVNSLQHPSMGCSIKWK